MNKSFTLIEILVVIVVIGIISSFIIIGLSSVSDKAKIAKSQAFINSVDNSLLLSRVSNWKLDGNANDSWGVNNGTLVGPTHLPVLKTGSDCVSGSCYSFDGTEDYIDCGTGSNLNILGELTISAWAKTIGSYDPLAGNWYYDNAGDKQGYRLDVDTTGYARITTLASLVTSLEIVNDNKWHYLVGVYNPSTFLKIYVDGKLSNTVTSGIPSSLNASTHGFHIGYYYSNGNSYFAGSIDDVHVYSAIVPALQIKEKYYSGLTKLLVSKEIFQKEYQRGLVKL